MSLTLRYMTLDDIPQVVEIDRQAFSTPWTPRSYTYEINESSHSYMVVLEQETVAPPAPTPKGLRRWWHRLTQNGASTPQTQRSVIAYGGLWNIMDEAHISTIAVRPELRGHGYGEIVLAAMVQRALNLTAEYIVLEVRMSNAVAQNLYLKHGFIVAGVKRNYYRDDSEDAYDMRLMITDKVRADYPPRFAALMTARTVTNYYTHTPHPRESVAKGR